MRGERAINPFEADVVRRIFRDYAAGKSGQRIAAELNKEGITAPTGGDWGFSTITGNPKRGTGIINNEMYVGKLTWNRLTYIKNPDTRKRQSRLNPESEWITQDIPELRIVDDALWQTVKERQSALRFSGVAKRNITDELNRSKRQRFLLSGLAKCGHCGSRYTMISASLLGCARARNKGTCDNRVNIRRDRLEERVLHALRHHLMDPALFAEFCNEFTREMNRLRMDGRASIDAARAEVKKIDRDLDMLLNLILQGGAADKINARMVAMEARKKELEQMLAAADEPPPLLHPSMAHHYREQLDELYQALREDCEAKRLEGKRRRKAALTWPFRFSGVCAAPIFSRALPALPRSVGYRAWRWGHGRHRGFPAPLHDIHAGDRRALRAFRHSPMAHHSLLAASCLLRRGRADMSGAGWPG